MLNDKSRVGFVELGSAHDFMLQHQAAVAGEIDVHDLDIRVKERAAVTGSGNTCLCSNVRVTP